MKPVTIKTAIITEYPRPMPEGMFDDMPSVIVIYDDGRKETLFSFYPDEITFTASEFKGLTRMQAHELHQSKYKNHLLK